MKNKKGKIATMQKKRLLLFFLLLSTAYTVIFAQNKVINTIEFYGIAGAGPDANSVSMAEDLFYRQLQDSGRAVKDSRSPSFSQSYISLKDDFFTEIPSGTAVFFAEIKKTSDQKWICTLHLKTGASDVTFSRTLESFSKILMESKKMTQNLLEKAGLIAAQPNSAQSGVQQQNQTSESLAGNWGGEEHISKIVILRGGRGFIFFKNGSSMNIKVETQKDSSGKIALTVTQATGNNASFYPELDRKTAMELAINAEPLVWNLTLTENGTLRGTKETFTQKTPEAPAMRTKISVEWKKL